MSRLQKSTILSFVALSIPAWATTRHVEDKQGCCTRYGQNCTGTEANPFCTIEDAVQDADTVDGDLILVASGHTYTPSGGRLDIGKVLAIVSDGSGDALERAATTTINATVNFQHGDLNAVGRRIEGFTITSPGTSGNNDGIRVSARVVDIVGNIIEDNADRGVDVNGASGKLVTLSGNLIRGNQNSGVYIETSPASICGNNQIVDNGSESDGGGIRLNGPDLVTVSDTAVRGNHADHDGGGIYAWGVDYLWLVNVTLEDNEALNVGGGVYVQGSPAFAISEEDPCLSTLYVDLKMQNCLVTCNDADYGSGVYISDWSEWHVVNSTIAFNGLGEESIAGGGVYSVSSCGTLFNSIVWGNEADSEPQFGFYGDNNVETGWSIVDDWTSCTGPFNCIVPVSGDDPKFVNVTSPCSGDEDFHVSGDSPAIDAGCNDKVLADATDLDDDCPVTGCTTEPTPLDLDLGPRFVDDPVADTGCDTAPMVDIGPYEVFRCEAASIVSAVPADGKQDARQPHPMNNNSFDHREGIGSPNSFTGYSDGPEPITIELDQTGQTDLACWSLCETGIETMEGGTLSDNFVESVTEVDWGVYEILLNRPISAGHWTTIEYFRGSDFVEYASLPADVHADGLANGSDITYWIDCCYNSTCAGYAKWRCDLDHSGAVTTTDYLTLIDLLNGQSTFISWNGVYLADNCCPDECEDSFLGPQPDEQSADVNTSLASWIVGYLVDVDLQGEGAVEDFSIIVDGLTLWCVDHFDASEKASLATALTDPGLTFASKIGANAASDMAATVTP